MPSRLYSIFVYLGGFAIIVAATCFIVYQVGNASTAASASSISPNGTATTGQAASIAASLAVATSTVTIMKITSIAASSAAVRQSSVVAASSTQQVVRVQNPYSTPPESFAAVNTDARDALVNILCMPRGGGSLAPISGSGVIIDPRGVILTNSHVAQYVLLSENAQINLSCQIRTGAPATAAYTADVLYMPPAWVNAHVSEINAARPTGTGEHDYALLRITGGSNGKNLPGSFPYLPFDTREAIAFLGDQVLGASYPAEFLGGMAAENELYPVSSISPIGQLLTFATSTVDVISIGGVIEAQSGSSGGPVVNQWGYLIGLITTTSDATTTGDRDLRAITLSYINRDIQTQTGFDLPTFLNGNLAAKEANFNTNIAPGLLKQYLQVLSQ